ncbi:hypothetical protein KA013_03770 [Patescibacteria group bacterium]|nr:hypothetical protein [Patescibacteria group bacterium]
MSQTKDQNGTNSRVGRKTLSNTSLCPDMIPFGTLADRMRTKKIAYLELIPGVAKMTLDEILVEGRREGVLHIGDTIQIRSQDVYEKYRNVIHKHLDPWSLEEIKTEARRLSQSLFRGAMQQNQTKVAEEMAAEQTLA